MQPVIMEDVFVYLTVIAIGLICSIFNIITILVILIDRKMRKQPSNYPVLSFLIASAIQGLLAAPLYVYKRLEHKEHLVKWLCDAYRVPYFFCGHTMKMSLVVVSIDRLIAVKYPFKYDNFNSRKIAAAILGMIWIGTVIVDILPFFVHDREDSECHYIPSQAWGLSVIILYNFTPFVITVVNYVLIWIVAVRFALRDKKINAHTEKLNKSLQENRESYGSVKHSSSWINLRFALEMKATKTTFMLLMVYLVCWGPVGVFYMADHFCKSCLSTRDDLSITRAVVKLLCFSSSVLAPLVYCWWNGDFQAAALKIFRKFCRLKQTARLISGKRTSRTETHHLVETRTSNL